MTDIYADIRPFNDDEVEQVLSRLSASDELLSALLQHRFSGLPPLLQRLIKPAFRRAILRQFRALTSVEGFQLWLEPKIEQLLKQTTLEVEVAGLDQLDASKTHVWISNHRDIAMDPTMINYSLHLAGWPTSRIAIGDNLLTNPDVADVMRLNKSFVVKRNIDNKRQKLRELQRLSSYIRYSIDQGESVWIAQREGRAKDNIDKTDTAVLKMLALHGRERKESFAETMAVLNPVPVSIQYEWDPCDVLKARELVMLARVGEYQKDAEEDIRSILQGLTGAKGRVKVNFGQPLTREQYQDADTMAGAIDEQLKQMEEVWPIHWAAMHYLAELNPELGPVSAPAELSSLIDGKRLELQQRFHQLDDEILAQVLKNYSVPVRSSGR